MKAIIPAFLAAALLASAASAQTAGGEARGLVGVQPVAASAPACAAGLIEIAPVSFDTAGRPSAWVVVHRVNGQVAAAERVSPEEIARLHRTPCKADSGRETRLGN